MSGPITLFGVTGVSAPPLLAAHGLVTATFSLSNVELLAVWIDRNSALPTQPPSYAKIVSTLNSATSITLDELRQADAPINGNSSDNTIFAWNKASATSSNWDTKS